MRAEPAALEGIKQLQRASLPTHGLNNHALVLAVPLYSLCGPQHRTEYVTLSMMVFNMNIWLERSLASVWTPNFK